MTQKIYLEYDKTYTELVVFKNIHTQNHDNQFW